MNTLYGNFHKNTWGTRSTQYSKNALAFERLAVDYGLLLLDVLKKNISNINLCKELWMQHQCCTHTVSVYNMCIVSNFNDMYILQHVHGNALLHDSAFFTPGQTSTALLRRSHWSQGLRHEGQTTSTFCVTRGEQHPNHTTKSKCHLYSDLCEFVWIHEIIRHHELKSLHIIDIQ